MLCDWSDKEIDFINSEFSVGTKVLNSKTCILLYWVSLRTWMVRKLKNVFEKYFRLKIDFNSICGWHILNILLKGNTCFVTQI